MISLLLAVLLVCASAQYCSEWIAIDLETQVPKAQPGDQLELYYIAAPLLYCSYLDELTYINGYHGGVGIKNLNTGFEMAINFDWGDMKGIFLPNITDNGNGNYSLTWANFGATYLYNGINDTYWHSLGRLHVATMTGNQFNQFRDFLSHVNETYTFYNPWFVYKTFPAEPLLEGFECFQAAFKFIQKAIQLGAKRVPGVDTLKVSLGTAYSDMNVTKVDFNSPDWHIRIVDFFFMLEERWDLLGFVGFLEELAIVLATGDFFIRNGDDYYFAEISFPFFEMHWQDFPILTKN